ncbi:MAG: aminoglycoside N(3)-acetyltransferase [Spirochaetaceae bacterium]|nr:MAG: aminoglycoside N(3)-acetyltransferase [Spirochaetaceae bacterium]
MPESSCSYGDIVDGLRALGVCAGAVVEVHSSLSAFGYVEGGASTIIKALTDVVTPEGTIVMSAYRVSRPVPLTAEDRARGVTWKVRRLPIESLEPSGMGIIADTFRSRADVYCGSDIHRTAAWGRDARWHCTGYDGLLAVDGTSLLLGVGIDRCSSMHAADFIPIPDAISAYWAAPADVQAAYDPHDWDVGCGETPDDAWEKVWRQADADGLIRHAQIGAAACHHFRARSVVGIYMEWRKTDPYGLYGVPRPVGSVGDQG